MGQMFLYFILTLRHEKLRDKIRMDLIRPQSEAQRIEKMYSFLFKNENN